MKSRVENFMPRGERCNSLSIKGNLANHLQGAGLHAAKGQPDGSVEIFDEQMWLSTAQHWPRLSSKALILKGH